MLHIDGGAEGWLRKYAFRNQWKVGHFLYDIDDLLQDGYQSWYICANRYSYVTDYGHMTSLFKLTYVNHIRWLATTDKNPTFEHMVTSISDLVDPSMSGLSESWIIDKVTGYSLDLSQGSDSREGFCRIVAEAAEPVRVVLRFLLSEEGIREMRKPFRKYLNGTRETVNSRIYRCLGLKQQGDLMGMVKNHILQYV